MKKIILCFDGTGNDPKDAKDDNDWFGLGDPEDNSISNVLKLHLLLGGDIQGNHYYSDQLSFYYSGVGTYGTWLDKLKNSFSAPPNEDVGVIIKTAMQDLYRNYECGDKLYIFGFSRGAAIARRFAFILGESYIAFGWKNVPIVNFMGVFDTVAALKKPNFFKEEIKPASDVVFENGTISSIIEKALHLLSIDERRIAFMPTLMNREDKVTEVWFSGAHSDIGGGFHYDGLSDNTLKFMIGFIENSTDISLDFLEPAKINYTDLFEGSEEFIKYEDILIQSNIMGKNHEQSAKIKLKEHILDYRNVRVNINDKHSVYPPIIHRSVFDRMNLDNKYNPKALESYLINPYTGDKSSIKVWEYDNSCQNYDSIDDAKNNSKVVAEDLNVGDSLEFTICANVKYNFTGIYLRDGKGQEYSFKVNMKQKWHDASIECNAKGWDRENDSLNFLQRQFIRPMEGFKRYPDANWFEIIATIGKNDENSFKLLDYSNGNKFYKPDVSGELFVFANDMNSKYGNNKGTIKVKIKRES